MKLNCGIAMLSGNWWAGLLTWLAFAVVVTATVTYVAARRRAAPASSDVAPVEEIRRLSEKVDELSRRLESLERSGGS
jgi:hypothetical protein